MNNRKESIPVRSLDAFEGKNNSFWISNLEGVLEKYSFLEHPQKMSCYSILFIEQASGSIQVDNHTTTLDGPKVVYIKPDSIFSITINRRAKGWLICFTEDFFSLRYNNNVLYQFAFLKEAAIFFLWLSHELAEKWSRLLLLVHQEMNNLTKGYEKVIRSYLNILLFDIDRKFSNTSDYNTSTNTNNRLVQFEKLVDEHFVQHKTPSWYAASLHITPNYLNKLCRENKHSTSGELIRKRIITEARRLLYYTALSVAEIAYELGFDNPSYFITFFKKNTGYTPESFRKKQHE